MNAPGGSHARACERFGSEAAASRYAGRLDGTRKDRLEQRAIARLLAGVPRGARVADLPCGTGRLLPFLAARGFRLHAADSSAHMVEAARARWSENPQSRTGTVDFSVRDIVATGFPDGHLDAVVCNRLFHHLSESETRVRALAELRRITLGPIIVSFFCALALDALVERGRDFLRRRARDDRLPLLPRAVRREAATAGLRVERFVAVRPGISQQWYACLRRVP